MRGAATTGVRCGRRTHEFTSETPRRLEPSNGSGWADRREYVAQRRRPCLKRAEESRCCGTRRDGQRRRAGDDYVAAPRYVTFFLPRTSAVELMEFSEEVDVGPDLLNRRIA